MKKKDLFFISLALIVVALLAFILRDAVRLRIILPMAKFFWLVKGYYGAFPQVAYWMVALGIALLVALFSFRLPDWDIRINREDWKHSPGAVREMSFWIQRARGGVYPKWHVAHLLAELALDILDRRGIRPKHERLITDPDWDPPADVRHYLDAALTTSYADYPRPKRFGPTLRTPFDQDLEPVIKYLESLLEREHDDHS